MKADKISAFIFGAVFLTVLLVVVIRVPQPTEPQWFVFRVVLALAAAGIGAVVPGFISVTVKPYVRAGGAIALFVVIYLLNPPALVRNSGLPVSSVQRSQPVESVAHQVNQPVTNASQHSSPPNPTSSLGAEGTQNAPQSDPAQPLSPPAASTGKPDSSAQEISDQITGILASPIANAPFFDVKLTYTYSGSRGIVRILVCGSQGGRDPLCNAVDTVESGAGRAAELPIHMATPGMLGEFVLDPNHPVDFEACFIQRDSPTHPPPKFGCRIYRYTP